MISKESPNYAQLSIDRPAQYRIRVRGELDERMSDRMGGMRISPQTQENRSIVTILEGQLLDQAALFGVLVALYNLHHPLISVECLDINREDENPLIKVRGEYKADRLEFIATGPQQALQTPEPIKTVLNSCKLAGVYRVLVDYRDLTGGDQQDPQTGYARGVGQVYQEYLAAGGIPVKIAVVGKEEMTQAWRQSDELVRGHSLEVFITSDYEEAIAWLHSETKGE